MKSIEQYISPLIESQFPAFYQQDGETFVAFVKAYYEWIESQNYTSRKLLEYRDIDYTIDEFVEHFKNEYMASLPADMLSDQRLLTKHIQDLYKSKGSAESYKLLFRILFNADIELYDPSTDVLRASDGIWIEPRYIECTWNDNSFGFIGKEITGAQSGAKAWVDNVVRKKINGRYIDIIYLSNLRGNFQTGEKVSDTDTLVNAPKIIGSLNEIVVQDGGSNNAVGDLYTISGEGGKGGQAVVKSIASGTGKVNFSIADGGFGFSNTAQTLVANVMLQVASTSANLNFYTPIEQPLAKVDYTSAPSNTTFALGDLVVGANATANVATGFIVNKSDGTSGNLVISATGGIWASATKVISVANALSNATLSAVANVTARGYIVDSNTTHVGLIDTSGTFYNNARLVGFQQTPIGLSTTNTTTTSVTGFNTYYSGSNTDYVFVRANNALVGFVANVNSNTSITLQANSLLNVANSTLWIKTPIYVSNVTSIFTSGSGADFNIGGIDNVELARLNTDIISSNNNVATNYLDLIINSTSYGMPGNTAGGYNSVLENVLSYTTKSVGVITGLSGIAQGNSYTIGPFVRAIDIDADHAKYDQVLTLSNTNSLFSPGQVMIQDVVLNRVYLTLSANTGAFIDNEGVTQVKSTNATGTIISSNTTTLHLEVISGTFDNSNTITGAISGATSSVSGFLADQPTYKLDGLIQAVESNTITVRRYSYNYKFTAGANVISIDSTGAQKGLGTIGAVTKFSTNTDVGFNASITTTVKSAQGITTTLEVRDSGLGYSNGQSLTLTKGDATITGLAKVERQGKGAGYWKNNQGKLNSDMYLHDNYYYQEYSYEIRSALALKSYADIVKKLIHVSGTEMFGKTIINSETQVEYYAPGVQIDPTNWDIYPSARIALDFTTGFYKFDGLYSSPTLVPNSSFTRASAAYSDDNPISPVLFASGVPRITSAGYQLESSDVNYIRNSRGEGAALNVTATYWTVANSAGVTIQPLGRVSIDGIQGVSYRIGGTAAAATEQNIYLEDNIDTSSFITSNTPLTAYMAILDGSTAGISSLNTRIYWSDTTYSTGNNIVSSIARTPQRFGDILAFPVGATTGRPMITLTPTNGATLDAVIWIGWPNMLQYGQAGISSPILPQAGTLAVSSRSSDQLVYGNTGSYPAASYIEFNRNTNLKYTTGVTQWASASGANTITMNFYPTSNTYRLNVTVNSVSQLSWIISSNTASANGYDKIAMNMASNGEFIVAINGILYSNTAASMPVTTNRRIGRAISGSTNIRAKKHFEYYSALSNTELQGLTS